jgi:hypothetical protein
VIQVRAFQTQVCIHLLCFSFLYLPHTSSLSIPMIILVIYMFSIPLLQTGPLNSGKKISANKKIMFHLFGTDWTQG